jgi:hypothetical protein
MIRLGVMAGLPVSTLAQLAYHATVRSGENQAEGSAAETRRDRRPDGFYSSDSGIRPSIGTENPIPEEIDHREIAVRMTVMSEVKFLHPSEPCKPPKPRSLDVVFLVKKDMRVGGRRAGDNLNHEEINRQDEVGTHSYQTHGNEEEGRIVAFVAKVRR